MSASLEGHEAVLRFPYDERLRVLLRAIPGRRWDAHERAWRLPLHRDAAESLARLLEGLPVEPRVSPALARRLRRSRCATAQRYLTLDVVRPDHEWWLTFLTESPAHAVKALLAHPRARTLPDLARGLVPLDESTADTVAALRACGVTLHASAAAERALQAVAARSGEALATSAAAGASAGGAGTGERRGGARGAALWRGAVEVDRLRGRAVFVLAGDPARLPAELRDACETVAGGAALELTPASWSLIREHLRAWPSPAARRCARALEAGLPAPPAVLELSQRNGHRAFVLTPGHDGEAPARFAALPGALAPAATRAGSHEHARLAAVYADPYCVPPLDELLAATGAWVEEDALAVLQEIREQHAHAAGLVECSQAGSGELDVAGLGGELKPFQRAAVSYALARRRCFIADEQGLGKTIEALAALQAAGAFPAVVVCPASLKLNWLAETRRWLPGRSVQVLDGLAGAAAAADVTVLNYDIVHARLERLLAARPRALVLDESHHCKNPAARRTQAVQRLAAGLPADGLVLALTGTPVLNGASELIAQLRILGRLEEFGSGARFAERFQGAGAEVRLHWHLRARCFVRRSKAQVLPQLPPKTRAVVPVELDNEGEYRLAERDLIAWLQTQPLDLRELDARVAAALRAERLVRLGALKLLAARGKLRSALAWINDFRASGERLVVFAHHREILHAVLERFGAALHVLGSDGAAARDAAVRAFQGADGPHNQIIVCSIAAGGQGLTLTRASNVVFLEQDWTPARHDQAEDRCHRIGQSGTVNATYLLAAGSVDETIAALLERKRAAVHAVTDGRERDGEAVLDALVRELRARPYRHLRAVA